MWDTLFPPNPMKVAERDRRAIEGGIELTDPAEFAAIKERQDTLEKRVEALEAWKKLMLEQRKEEDGTGTGTTQ